MRKFAIAILAVVLLSAPAFAVHVQRTSWSYFEALGRVRVTGRLENPERGYKSVRLVTLRATVTVAKDRLLREEFKVTVLPDSDAEFEHDIYGVAQAPGAVAVEVVSVE